MLDVREVYIRLPALLIVRSTSNPLVYISAAEVMFGLVLFHDPDSITVPIGSHVHWLQASLERHGLVHIRDSTFVPFCLKNLGQ